MEKDKRSESERTESVCGSALGRPAARQPGRDAARAAGRGAAGRARALPRSREARSTSKIGRSTCGDRSSLQPRTGSLFCSVLRFGEIGPVPTSPTPLLQGGIVFYFEGVLLEDDTAPHTRHVFPSMIYQSTERSRRVRL